MQSSFILSHAFASLNVTGQLGNALAQLGMNQVRSDFRQRYKNESPVMQAGMRDSQVLGFHHLVVVEKYIYIHDAGRIPKAGDSAHAGFDGLSKMEKPIRRQIRGDTTDQVEKQRLLRVAYRLGLID
jgi:hypothetical protein